jgi:hypothetical protein
MSQGALKVAAVSTGTVVGNWSACGRINVQLLCVKISIGGWRTYRRIQRAASDAEWRWDRRWIGVENKSGQ